RAIDDARIRLRQRRVAQPLRLERAGAEVLEEDVGGRGELSRAFEPCIRGEVERHALLVAAERGEETRARALEVARRIALARGLDLDHFGAEIREDEP